MKKHLSVAVYTIAALFFLAPIVETILSIAPWRFGEVRWRFGAMGLVSRASLEPVLGLLLAFVMGWYAQHRGLLRAISIVSYLGALLLALFTGLFILDALQVRAALNDAGKNAVAIAALAGSVKFVLVMIGLIVLGACAWKAARRAGGRQGGSASPPPTLPLVTR